MQATTKLTLGEKIRNFRKRAGMSQLELEAAIQTSPGVISRIEAGKVNPTKETLLEISSVLRLPPTERFHLLDETYQQINEKDVSRVISNLKELFRKPGFLGYLIDDKYTVIAISESFKEFMQNLGIDPTKLERKNMLEVIFNPDLGIRGIIKSEEFESVAINLLAFFNQELSYRLNEPWWKELTQDLYQYPEFKELWETTQRTEVNGYDPEARVIEFDIGGQIIKTFYNLTAIYDDPRFTIAEYIIVSST